MNFLSRYALKCERSCNEPFFHEDLLVVCSNTSHATASIWRKPAGWTRQSTWRWQPAWQRPATWRWQPAWQRLSTWRWLPAWQRVCTWRQQPLWWMVAIWRDNQNGSGYPSGGDNHHRHWPCHLQAIPVGYSDLADVKPMNIQLQYSKVTARIHI